MNCYIMLWALRKLLPSESDWGWLGGGKKLIKVILLGGWLSGGRETDIGLLGNSVIEVIHRLLVCTTYLLLVNA